MNNVLIMPGFGQRDVGAILETAKNASLESCLILGWSASDELFISSSEFDAKEILWLLEKAKRCILRGESGY